jgi:hypothetical protein
MILVNNNDWPICKKFNSLLLFKASFSMLWLGTLNIKHQVNFLK